MQVAAIQPKIDASHLPLESLASNQSLTEDQKVAEASRQFEAILVRQFLAESASIAVPAGAIGIGLLGFRKSRRSTMK